MTTGTRVAGHAIVAAVLLTVVGCDQKPPTNPSPNPGTGTNCSFAVSGAPTTPVVATGASVTLSVTTSQGCSWTASSNSAFITVTSSTNSGSGTVQLNVQPNIQAARQGSVQVAGQSILLDQAAGSPDTCDFALNPTATSVAAQGGDVSISVTVTHGVNCAWTAASNDAFITVKQGASGTGNGGVVLSVATNQAAARAGSATIGGHSVVVSQDAVAPSATPVAVLSFQSDVADLIGNGQSASYTLIGSQFQATTDPAHRTVTFKMLSGDAWQLDLSAGPNPLTPGLYPLAERTDAFGAPGVQFLRPSQSCTWVIGRFLVGQADFGAGNTVSRFHARFDQHCNGMSTGLRGELWIDAQGSTTPSALATFPAPSAPTTFLTIQSDAGDFVGQGGSATYTLPASVFYQGVMPGQPWVSIVVTSPSGVTGAGDFRWQLDFSGPFGSGTRLLPGTYDPAPSTPGQPAGSAGLSISGTFASGSGRGCGSSTGRFVVLEAVYDNVGAIYRFRATFEQHCLGAVPAIRGEIYIVANPWR